MATAIFITFGVTSFMYWAGAITSPAYGILALMLAWLLVLFLLKKQEEADKEWIKQRQEERKRKEEKEYQEWMKKIER